MIPRLTVVALLAAACCLGPSESAGAYVYWTGNAAETIDRANLDGTGLNGSFIPSVDNPLGVAQWPGA